MPPKAQLAEALLDNGFVEMERKRQGNRRTVVETAKPIIERGPTPKKRPGTHSAHPTPSMKVSMGVKSHVKQENQDPLDVKESEIDDVGQGWAPAWWDDDDGSPPPSTEPELRYKPGIFERDPNAKTGDGKTTHEYMEGWRETSLPAYFYTMLEREGLGGYCETCRQVQAEYRCLDCMGCPRFCTTCCRHAHRHDPLHRIECWVEDAWQPAWLWHVGTIICLGHGLDACPAGGRSREALEEEVVTLTAADLPQTRMAYQSDPTLGAKPPPGALGRGLVISVVHTNGFHHLPVHPCKCKDASPRDIQLLKAGLYPITSAQTQTVFTFQVLKHFHLMKVDAHLAVEQYCDTLRRLTDDIFPDKTLDRRREITRAWQQYNYMTLLKRHGFGITGPLETPGKGKLAMFCAVCPQAGVNIPPNWRELNDPWRFWRYLTADGNFVLDHLEIAAPDVAVWLTNGASFMTERTRFASFIGTVHEDDEHGDCNELRAVAERNKTRRGYDSTGIVAVACARHGCFAPGGVADMQKGERQANVDYILCESVETTQVALLNGLRFAYDVNCQYCVKFRARIMADSCLSFPEELAVAFLIGLFHVHGHVEECLARYAPTYLPGAGVTAAEILESLWSTLNGAAGPTRNMTLAHRSETLDACMSDSNWKKFQGMIAWLISQHGRASKESKDAKEDFEELDESVTEAQQTEWSELMQKANAERIINPKAMDVYNVKLPKVETKKDVQARLMRAEQDDEGALMGVAAWIASGIAIQDEQLKLQAIIRAGAHSKPGAYALELEKKREAIIKLINGFLKEGGKLWPEVLFTQFLTRALPEREPCVCEALEECICGRLLGEYATNEQAAFVKNPDTIIPLPSTVENPPPQWAAAAATEEKLRVAQCHEALEELRKLIARKSHLYRNKKSLSSGQRSNRKSYDAIGKVETNMRQEVKRYDLARGSLIRLNALQRHPELREIEREHTKAVVSVYTPNAREQSKAKLSWIWTTATGKSDTDDAYVRDLYRINWIRARSRRDRWNEELVLVESEMEWLVRFAKHRMLKARSWAKAALTHGHSSYSLRQAKMWLRVGTAAKAEFLRRSNVGVGVKMEEKEEGD